MYTWSTGRSDVVAQYLTRQEINANSGMLKQVAIGPDEAAVLVRNGKVEETLTQDKLKKFSGGFVNWAAQKLGGGEDVRVLFVLTSPIDLKIPFGGESVYALGGSAPAANAGRSYERLLTRDQRPAVGVITLRFNFDVANAVKVMNFLRTNPPFPGQPANVLTRSDLGRRFHDELISNVLNSIVRSHSYSDLSGNLDVKGEIDASLLSYCRKTFDTFGITLSQAFAAFDPTQFDRVQELAGHLELEERVKDIRWSSTAGDARRAAELEKSRDQYAADMTAQKWRNTKMIAELQESVTDVHVEAARSREQKRADDALARRRAEADEQLRAEGVRKARESDEKDRESERDMAELNAVAKVQGEARQARGQIELQSQTIRANAEVERAKYQSQAAASNVETFKAGLDTALQHSEKMASIQSQMMASAKPNVPTTLVQGGSGSSEVLVGAAGKAGGGASCPTCGEPVKKTWKVCPDCGASLAQRTCAKCGEPLKATWKSCPECGAASPLKGG